jgi:hypothetical protein
MQSIAAYEFGRYRNARTQIENICQPRELQCDLTSPSVADVSLFTMRRLRRHSANPDAYRARRRRAGKVHGDKATIIAVAGPICVGAASVRGSPGA